MSPDEAMKPSCDICHQRQVPNNDVPVDGGSFFGLVCHRCIARIELYREKMEHRSHAESESVERAISDAKRALGDQSFVDKLPAVPDRGFVTIRFSTEYTDYV